MPILRKCIASSLTKLGHSLPFLLPPASTSPSIQSLASPSSSRPGWSLMQPIKSLSFKCWTRCPSPSTSVVQCAMFLLCPPTLALTHALIPTSSGHAGNGSNTNVSTTGSVPSCISRKKMEADARQMSSLSPEQHGGRRRCYVQNPARHCIV